MPEQKSFTDFTHRFIPAQARNAPTLLLLHGTGGNEDDLLDLGRMLSPTSALLSPRGKVLENGMPRFFRRFSEGVFDIEDLKTRTYELATFLRDASTTYNVDLNAVIAVGFSNGANIAASMLLLQPDLLSGAVLFRPMVPLTPSPLPDLTAVPIFIGAGRTDQIIPTHETVRLQQLLQQTGASITLHWQPGGHALTREDVRTAQSWLREYFKL